MASSEDAPEPRMLSVGDVVADRYRVDAVLGRGGMGVVYRAEHLHLRKPYALKVLLPLWSSTPEVSARFEREAVAAGSIQSPHVAAATDFGRLADGSFFLVMEYVSGRTLRALIEGGPLEPARAIHVLRGIAAGLNIAHGLGIVHRDMKPENVIITEREGDRDFVKILDFGIARVDAAAGGGHGIASQPLTQVGTLIGTPDYMSPEQALGQPVDARSDLYSLGVILFEMLTGAQPFSGSAVTVLRQHVMAEVPELPVEVAATADPRVAGILKRLLAKAPENRPASAVELMAALDECSLERANTAPPPPAPASRAPAVATKPLFDVVARRPLVAAAVVVAVVVAAIVIVVVADASPDGASPAAATSVMGAPTGVSLPGLPGSASPAGTANAGAADLPPPPTPSSRAVPAPSVRPASSARRTGPGGIYIPPPSQWFR